LALDASKQIFNKTKERFKMWQNPLNAFPGDLTRNMGKKIAYDSVRSEIQRGRFFALALFFVIEVD
jgi:hypothetical protein